MLKIIPRCPCWDKEQKTVKHQLYNHLKCCRAERRFTGIDKTDFGYCLTKQFENTYSRRGFGITIRIT